MALQSPATRRAWAGSAPRAGDPQEEQPRLPTARRRTWRRRGQREERHRGTPLRLSRCRSRGSPLRREARGRVLVGTGTHAVRCREHAAPGTLCQPQPKGGRLQGVGTRAALPENCRGARPPVRTPGAQGLNEGLVARFIVEERPKSFFKSSVRGAQREIKSGKSCDL